MRTTLFTLLCPSILLLAGTGELQAQLEVPMGGPASSQPSEALAADVVAGILAGRDDPDAWGALEVALGQRPSATEGRGSTAGELVVDRGIEAGAGGDDMPATAGGEVPAALGFVQDLRVPAWLGEIATPRVVAGVVAGLLFVLMLVSVRLLLGVLVRAARAVAPRRRRGRTLVRRRSGRPLARDAERLNAQLRARRVA